MRAGDVFLVSAALLNPKGDDMADAGAQKSKTGDVDEKGKIKEEVSELQDQVVEDVKADVKEHEEDRSEADRDQQQDLNQGMDTGTHDTERTGINWGEDYRARPGSEHKILRGDTPDEPAKK
jgi:hypothetical protein